ncbi:MAG TPA: methyltransferase domain-containing protein [Rhizomicrobium sp.]
MSPKSAPNGLRRLWHAVRFLAPADIALFLKSAKTDAAIARWRIELGSRAAFENAYGGDGDPWAAASPRYRYQSWKYDRLVALLPKGRRFAHALDLGCGLGLLSTRLAARADQVTGIDIAQAAVDRAAARASAENVHFQQGDVTDIPSSLDGLFDLVVIADVLYYLPPPITAEVLGKIAARIAKLLVPGGLCVLVNHYFFSLDPDSRLSRRIHGAFITSPHFRVVSQHRRPFYIVSMLDKAG